MSKHYVYVHTNKVNGKKYVGVTTRCNPKWRWREGNGYLTRRYNGEYCQPKFARAIIKYGWDNFDHQVWEVYSKESMLFWEKFLIEKYDSVKNGYNITSGGEFPKQALETIERRRLSLKNYWKNLDPKIALKRKQHLASVGEPYRHQKGCKGTTMKPIVQLSLDGNYIKDWESATAAGKSLHKRREGIKDCLRGRQKTAYGYKWRYKDES